MYPPISKVIDERRSPAAQAFNRSAAELIEALANAKRRFIETERFLQAMRRRPLTRPESRVER